MNIRLPLSPRYLALCLALLSTPPALHAQHQPWGGLRPDAEGWINAGQDLGYIYVGQRPWIWSYGLNSWFYSNDPGSGATGLWMYMPITLPDQAAAAAPTFDPAAGTYIAPFNVTLSTSTDGASIYYTTDGSDPDANSTPYTGTINVSESLTLKAIAIKDGLDDSTIATADYILSSLPAKPTAANTGYTGPLTPYTGSSSITVDGTVIENVEISGGINIKANNVIIRNCLINGGLYGVRANYGATGLLVEDCEIIESQSAAIYGSNFTARRLNVHDSYGDAFKPVTNVRIEYCYAHHLGKSDGAHADAVQSRDGGTDMIFRYNNFDISDITPPYKGNSTFIMQSANGQITNTLVEYNWLNGGSYTYNGGSMSGITVRNNFFGRDYQFGIRYPNSAPTWYDNVWEDDGTPAE